jgi:hypothetical protein
LSLIGDLSATLQKSVRTGLGGPENLYASGLNRLFRSVARELVEYGASREFRRTFVKTLIKFGDKATPVFAVGGAFSLGYNLSIAVQCALGALE